MEKYKFRVHFLEEAKLFLDSLDNKTREKIIYNIWKSRQITDNELFKKLKDDIWEFRTKYKGITYRLFAFWDKTDKTDTLVISTHGIKKKTQKTPTKEIEKTKDTMKLYFQTKTKKQ